MLYFKISYETVYFDRWRTLMNKSSSMWENLVTEKVSPGEISNLSSHATMKLSNSLSTFSSILGLSTKTNIWAFNRSIYPHISDHTFWLKPSDWGTVHCPGYVLQPWSEGTATQEQSAPCSQALEQGTGMRKLWRLQGGSLRILHHAFKFQAHFRMSGLNSRISKLRRF